MSYLETTSTPRVTHRTKVSEPEAYAPGVAVSLEQLRALTLPARRHPWKLFMDEF
jgi:hypothetical protein